MTRKVLITGGLGLIGKELIYKLGEVEHQIKINFDNSINIITDFILEQTSNRSSN